MAKYQEAENGMPWLEISWQELAGYAGTDHPVCDECMKSLEGCEYVVLIPILNEAFCPECGEKLLAGHRFPEDRPIEERRVDFWLNYFNIQKGAE